MGACYFTKDYLIIKEKPLYILIYPCIVNPNDNSAIILLFIV